MTTDRILGFTAFGSGVGELLPVVQLAMSANLPCTSIQALIVTHPTTSEELVSLLSAQTGETLVVKKDFHRKI